MKIIFNNRDLSEMGVAMRLVASGSLAMAAAGTARAEGPGEVVVTGTRTPEQSQRAAVKTDVVSRAEAERRGATSVGEALQSQPGVRFNPSSGYGHQGGLGGLQIQGFEAQRVLVLEDGERVVGDVGGAVDVSQLSLADVERIEIVTGPTSSLYGSSAIGGVVNVLTAPPRLVGPSGRLRLEGRSRRGLVAQGSAARRGEAAWAAVDAGYQRHDGVARLPDRPDRQVPDGERWMVGLRAGLKLSERSEVRARVRRYRDRAEGLESQQAPGLGRYLIDRPDTVERTTAHLIQLHELGGGSGLRLTVGKQWYEGQSDKRYRGSPVGEERRRSYTMQSAEGVATLADGPRTWVLGARFEGERFDQRLRKASSGAGGLVSDEGAEVAPVLLASAAIYAQLRWQLGALTVLPGVRHEAHRRYGQALAPRLSVAWAPSAALRLRASGGRGFRAPSAKELGFVFDHSFYGYRVAGNDALRPETSWGLNADVTAAAGGGLTLRAGAFANRVDGLIDVALAEGARDPSGVVTYRYRNLGDATTAGGHGGIVYAPGSAVRTELIYDLLVTRDGATGRPLSGRAAHVLTASARLALPAKAELYVRWRAQSGAYLTDDSRSPPYQTLDARLARALWPRAQGYVGVLNALDVRQEPGRVGDTRPPLGRVVYAGLTAEFPWEEDE